MKDLTCPHCGHEQEGCDIYNTEITHEVECEKCEKIYGVVMEYWPSYTCTAMPCANGQPHNMIKTTRAPQVVNGECEYHCQYCDYKENFPSKCSKVCNLDKSGCWKCENSMRRE